MFDLRLLLAAAAILSATPALAETRSYDLAAFHAIDIQTGIDATVVRGDGQSVIAEARASDTLTDLKVEVVDGTLKAYVDRSLFDFRLFDRREIRVTITVPALDAVSASSGADVRVDGLAGQDVRVDVSSGADINVINVAAETIDIDISSGADATLAGTCGTARVSVSSGSNLNAGTLECRAVNAEVSSGADADVFASADLRAEASSGGDITVHGNPAERAVDESSAGGVTFD